MKTIQLTKYKTFFYFIFNNTKSLYPLCPRWLKNLLNPWLKFSVHSCKFVVQPKYENKANSKPIKANFSEVNLRFKRKNEDFRQI